MSFETAVLLVKTLAALETKAVTITGGGEPLLHPNFQAIASLFLQNNISIGLVTNGTALHLVDPWLLNQFTWVRISHASERIFSSTYAAKIAKLVRSCQDVDWAFSYVVQPDTTATDVTGIIDFANKNNFTHVRLVSDLFQPSEIDMAGLKSKMSIDDSNVIYQARTLPEKGTDCRICYLKPLIGADGNVYTCCGAQYALDPPSKFLPEELCLGTIIDLPNIVKGNADRPFDGSICRKCYYGDYNRVLSAMCSTLEHEAFV